MTFSTKSCRLDEGPNLRKSVELRLRPRRRHNAHADDGRHHHSNAGKAKEEEGCHSVDDSVDRADRSVALLVNNREALGAHEVPQPPPCNSLARRGLRYLSLAAILVAWLWLTSLEAKIRAVMVALTFSAIEFHFRAVTRPSAAELNRTIIIDSTTTTRYSKSNPDERDMRRAMGLAEVGRRRSTDQLRAMVSTARARLAPAHLRTNGHTTWEQFWANVFYGPIMNDFYRHHLFALALPSFLAWDPLSQALLLALFYPLNIWVAEVVMGYYLSRVWRRRAWYYRGRWARLDGNITLAYGPLWHLLGGLYAVGYPLVYAPVPAYLASLLVM